MTLAPGATVAGTIATKYETGLFEYAPADGSPTILDFSAVIERSHRRSRDAPSSRERALGRRAHGRRAGDLGVARTDPIYAVYFDDSGSTGSYTVGVTATAPAATAPTTAGDSSMAGAVVAPALPFVLTGGLLTSSASQDWVAVTTGASDANKALRVQSAGDPHTYLDVTIYDGDGQTSIGGNETGGPVDARSVPLAASTTYYVVFSAGAGFDPTHGGYVGIIRLE